MTALANRATEVYSPLSQAVTMFDHQDDRTSTERAVVDMMTMNPVARRRIAQWASLWRRQVGCSRMKRWKDKVSRKDEKLVGMVALIITECYNWKCQKC